MDGTDFRIQEPTPFSKKCYSSKFNAAGLRYEVAICIQTGWIVWVNGPYPPGEWNDLRIAMEELVYMFEGDERAVADKGYRGHPMYFDTPWRFLDTLSQRVRKALARARHETVNRRFKHWQILKQVFRHDIAKHGTVFFAVANIEQFLLMHRPTWQVEYYDREDNWLDL